MTLPRLAWLAAIAALGCRSEPPPPTGPPPAAAAATSAADDASKVRFRLASNGGTWSVAFDTEPAPIPLNEPFAIHGRIEALEDPGAPIDRVVVDAGMPQHRHGMARAASTGWSADGTFAARNLLFHMPGRWTITIDVRAGGITERAQCEVEVD